MNFAELCRLHAERGSEREAIAKALGLTPTQIDELQKEAERIASEIGAPLTVLPVTVENVASE